MTKEDADFVMLRVAQIILKRGGELGLSPREAAELAAHALKDVGPQEVRE